MRVLFIPPAAQTGSSLAGELAPPITHAPASEGACFRKQLLSQLFKTSSGSLALAFRTSRTCGETADGS